MFNSQFSALIQSGPEVAPVPAMAPSANDLEQRLILFGMNIMKLSAQVRQSPESRHIANQILRSGTAAAPNYAEARAAESRADFIHKLRIALKELNETLIWLRMIEGMSRKTRTFCPV